MTTLEPIFAILIGAGLTAGAGWVSRFLAARSLLKYGPVLSRVYDVLDPLLERNMRSWNGSDVEFAVELAIESVADGYLSATELKELTLEVTKRWLPQVAADKVRKFEAMADRPKTLAAADLLTDVISGQAKKEETIAKVKTLLQ
jgi:hypothetical protein